MKTTLTKAQEFLLQELAKEGTYFFSPGAGEKTYCLFPEGCPGAYRGKRYKPEQLDLLFELGLIERRGWPCRVKLVTSVREGYLPAGHPRRCVIS